MKTCSTCQVSKEKSEFQVRAASHDGLTAACKACLKDRDAARYAKERPMRLAAMQRYAQTERGKEAHARAVAKWREDHANRRAANVLLNNAVKAGKVVPWPVCAMPTCKTKKVEGHHPDYDRPLEVVWLCRKHHAAAHSLFTELLREESRNGN